MIQTSYVILKWITGISDNFFVVSNLRIDLVQPPTTYNRSVKRHRGGNHIFAGVVIGFSRAAQHIGVLVNTGNRGFRGRQASAASKVELF